MSTADQQSYLDAVSKLNSLQSNAADIEKSRKLPVAKNAGLEEFERFMRRTSLSVSDLGQLSVIHVSGTKGKGSTCAMVESILRNHGVKTGFFSSPHLVEVRERIRLNGEPLSYSTFADYFWFCYNRLQESKTEGDSGMPPYFRFLNLMSFHIFLQEKVDVAIMEVGIGGRYDTTNIVPSPVVCGISSLGYDHTALLGNTLREIGWHKAGIMKTGTVAFTAPQADEGMAVLAEEAEKVKVPLHVCPPLSQYPPPLPDIGLAGDHQQANASLALQLSRAWLQRTGREAPESCAAAPAPRATEGRTTATASLSESSTSAVRDVPVAQPFHLTPMMNRGLADVHWPGRCDVIRLPKVTVYLDGAHTVRSAQACSKWFRDVADQETQEKNGSVFRAMIFNSTGGRQPESLLSPLMDLGIGAALFCPNITTTGPSAPVDMTNNMVTTDIVTAACWHNDQVWTALHKDGTRGTDASASTTGAAAADSDPQGSDVSPVSIVLPCVQDSLAWLCEGHCESFRGLAPTADAVRGAERPVALRDADHVQVLVVGSLHLVGTALAVLRDCCGINPTVR